MRGTGMGRKGKGNRNGEAPIGDLSNGWLKPTLMVSVGRRKQSIQNMNRQINTSNLYYSYIQNTSTLKEDVTKTRSVQSGNASTFL